MHCPPSSSPSPTQPRQHPHPLTYTQALKWANVAFLATFHTPDVIFEQLSFMWALPKYLVKSLKIVLPFFPTGTMERVVTYGEVATAKTLAKMVSMTPLTQCGPSQLILLDIHALQNQFYFDDNVVPRLYSATDLLMLELAQLPEEEKKRLSIAFPDDGAHKRFASQFGSLECIICAKVRHEDKRIVTIKEGSCKDRHVIIVDDLVHSGGTLLECVKACQNNGAAKVSAFVTHAVFEQAAWKKFTKEGLGITTFYITNTHPMASELKDVKPFKVLSVAPLLMPILLNSET